MSFSLCAVVSVSVWYDGGATCDADGPRLLASDSVKTDGWEVLDWLGGGGVALSWMVASAGNRGPCPETRTYLDSPPHDLSTCCLW